VGIFIYIKTNVEYGTEFDKRKEIVIYIYPKEDKYQFRHLHI
jgi:hypothetical protein